MSCQHRWWELVSDIQHFDALVCNGCWLISPRARSLGISIASGRRAPTPQDSTAGWSLRVTALAVASPDGSALDTRMRYRVSVRPITLPVRDRGSSSHQQRVCTEGLTLTRRRVDQPLCPWSKLTGGNPVGLGESRASARGRPVAGWARLMPPPVGR
jgi:hypothetical protein